MEKNTFESKPNNKCLKEAKLKFKTLKLEYGSACYFFTETGRADTVPCWGLPGSCRLHVLYGTIPVKLQRWSVEQYVARTGMCTIMENVLQNLYRTIAKKHISQKYEKCYQE